MSGVSNGQYANQDSFNDAFMTRNGDTDTIGKVALNNDDGVSGAHIANTQRYVNEIADASGVAGEGDTTRKTYSSTNYVANGDNRKVAIGKLDTQAKATQDEVDDHEARITDIESNPSSFGGDKVFEDDVIIQGDLTVNGTRTFVNTTDLDVTDKNITTNKGGNDASSEGGGLDIERTTTNAAIRFKNALASKFEIGLVGSLHEVIVSGVAQVVAGIKDFTSGIKTDTVDESTTNTGVTIDGVLVKDGNVDGRDVSVDGTALDGHIANTSNPHSVTKTQVGLGNVTNDAQLKRSANDYSGISSKAVPAGADLILIEDSAASFAKKTVTVASLASGSGGTPSHKEFVMAGAFNKQGVLTGPDGNFRFPWDATITNIQLTRQIAGSSGTTEADIEVLPPAGSWTSILDVLGSIDAAAGDDAAVGTGDTITDTVAPELIANAPVAVVAGTQLRVILTQVEVGSANTFTVIVFFEKT